jgi:hypothetical protein
MPTYDVTVGGVNYEVDAPDETKAWEYANYTHRQSQAPAAAPIEDTQRLKAPLGNEPSMGGQALSVAAPVIRGAVPPLANMTAGATLGGLVGGIPGAAVGASAGAIADMVGDPLVLGVNKLFGTRITTPTEAWTHIMEQAGIRESSSEYDKLLEAIARGGASSLSTIGAGALLRQMTSPIAKTIGTALASEPIQQVAAGAMSEIGAQAGSQTAEVLGAEETGQIVGGLMGGVAGGVAGSKMTAPRMRPELRVPGLDDATIRETIQKASEAGRQVFTSDVMPPKTTLERRLQDFREGTLFGTASARDAQQAQRLEYIQEVLNSFDAGADKELAASIAQNLNKTKSDRIAHWTGQKNNVLDRVSFGVPPLKTTELSRTFTTLKDEIDGLNAINRELYAPIVAKLEAFGRGLLGDPIIDPASGTILGYTGKSLQAVEKNLQAIKPFLANDQSLGSIKSPVQQIGQKIYGSLSEDIKGVIRNTEGQASVDQYTIAKAKLHEGIKDLESDTLRAIFRKADVTPEQINTALFSKRPSEIRLLLANLDANGRAFARTAILSRAAQMATDPATREISTAKFSTALGKLSKETGIFFSGDDLKAVQGLANYLNLTKRAESFNIDPQTGARVLAPLGASMLVDAIGKGLAIASVGTAGLLARVYESPVIRKLLIDFPRKNNSNEQIAAIKRVSEAIAAEAGNYEKERIQNKQVTFIPENTVNEQLGNGTITTDNNTGYRIISRDGSKYVLHAPDNKRVGIFDSFERARNRAELEHKKRK